MPKPERVATHTTPLASATTLSGVESCPCATNDASGGRHRVELAALVSRARSEFTEMPGLQLTPRQAARLWAVDVETATDILGVLVRADFLVSRLGRYAIDSAR